MAAKLLVHLLGEWKGQAEIVEGRGRGREWGGKEEGRKWECTKKLAPKRNICGIWGGLFVATVPCHSFLESYSGTTFLLQIVCFYRNRLKVIELQS